MKRLSIGLSSKARSLEGISTPQVAIQLLVETTREIYIRTEPVCAKPLSVER